MPKKKKQWKPMEMSRVRLNPEQAVLSCCDNEYRDMDYAADQCECGPCFPSDCTDFYDLST